MAARYVQTLPEGVTVADQVDFLLSECDVMSMQTDWTLQRGGDVQDVVTARRLARFLVAVREELLSIRADPDQDPATCWLPRHRQALLWALGIETSINFDEETGT